MTISCSTFYDLSLDSLYAIMALRQEIFVVEQNCPYLDADGKDQHSYHVMGFDDAHRLIAYTRLLPKGLAYPGHVAIGRVVTADSERGKGIGKKIMTRSIEECERIFGKASIKLSAQCHLQKFYEGFGFIAFGNSYLEDGIPHIAMVLEKRQKNSQEKT